MAGLKTPAAVKQMLFAAQTGSFIQGLAKIHGLPSSSVMPIALLILKVAIGEIELAKLGAVLSSELGLANDKSQAIATEIERDLFAPVMLDLNQYLEKRKAANQGGLPPEALLKGGARNVLDLKNRPKPPVPPPIIPPQNPRPRTQRPNKTQYQNTGQ